MHFIDTQKRKLRQFSVPLMMLLASTSVQASCSKLAKIAGMNQVHLQKIVDKLIKIETSTGKYNTLNHRSGAYGRYQIMPSTATFYAKKLGIPKHLWKKPYNQDKIFRAIMKDNIKSLKRNGYRISAFSIYATHQQGVNGFKAIMKGKPINRHLERNLRKNLPTHLARVKKSRLRSTWIRYWKNRLS